MLHISVRAFTVSATVSVCVLIGEWQITVAKLQLFPTNERTPR